MITVKNAYYIPCCTFVCNIILVLKLYLLKIQNKHFLFIYTKMNLNYKIHIVIM